MSRVEPYDHTHWGRSSRARNNSVNGVPFQPLRAFLGDNLAGYRPATHHVMKVRKMFHYNPDTPITVRYTITGEKVFHEAEFDREETHAWFDSWAPEWRDYFPRAVRGSDGVYRPKGTPE